MIHYNIGDPWAHVVEQGLIDKDEILRQLKYNLQWARNWIVKTANLHRRDESFIEGNWVYVKLRPHRQHYVVHRVHAKLSPRLYGLFQIIKRVGLVAYRLRLPEEALVHQVFHASQLKRAIGDHSVEESLPTELCTNLDEMLEPLATVAEREV